MSRADRRARTSELFQVLTAATDAFERDVLREQIILVNMGVARSVAHRYRGRGEYDEDLEQVAFLGLVNAVNGFEVGYHKDFLTYAVPTISGELKKHFRDHCWTVRPPRRVQELQGRIADVTDGLSQQYDHWPSPPEVADALGVDSEQVSEAMAATGCFTPASLDLPAGRTDSTAIGDLLGAEDHGFAESEAHVLLAPVVRELSARDRDVIERRFFEEWTQERIAQELGITQVQVSRSIARILRSLQSAIGPTGDALLTSEAAP